jgi:hypothetical protein
MVWHENVNRTKEGFADTGVEDEFAKGGMKSRGERKFGSIECGMGPEDESVGLVIGGVQTGKGVGTIEFGIDRHGWTGDSTDGVSRRENNCRNRREEILIILIWVGWLGVAGVGVSVGRTCVEGGRSADRSGGGKISSGWMIWSVGEKLESPHVDSYEWLRGFAEGEARGVGTLVWQSRMLDFKNVRISSRRFLRGFGCLIWAPFGAF